MTATVDIDDHDTALELEERREQVYLLTQVNKIQHDEIKRLRQLLSQKVATNTPDNIEDIKIFVSKVGAATTPLQFKTLSREAHSIRTLIDELL